MAINTIMVKGRGIGKEAVAAGAILPGSFLEYKSTGKVGVHATAGGAANRIIARENELAGKGIADSYAADDTVFFETVQSGFEVLTHVAASTAAIVIGDKLVSDGLGGVRKMTAITDAATAGQDVIGTALQAVDNSGNASSKARILIEVI